MNTSSIFIREIRNRFDDNPTGGIWRRATQQAYALHVTANNPILGLRHAVDKFPQETPAEDLRPTRKQPTKINGMRVCSAIRLASQHFEQRLFRVTTFCTGVICLIRLITK